MILFQLQKRKKTVIKVMRVTYHQNRYVPNLCNYKKKRSNYFSNLGNVMLKTKYERLKDPSNVGNLGHYGNLQGFRIGRAALGGF